MCCDFIENTQAESLKNIAWFFGQKWAAQNYFLSVWITIWIFSGWGKCPGNECIDCIEVMRQEMRLWPLGTCPRCLMTIRCWGAAELRPPRRWSSLLVLFTPGFLSVPSLQSQCPVSSARIRPGQCYHCNTQSVGEEYSVNQSFTSVKNNWRPDWALKCFIVDNQRFQLRFESSLTGRSEQDHNPSKECKFFEEI